MLDVARHAAHSGSLVTPDGSTTLVASEVVILASLLIVAAFVESTFAQRRPEQSGLSLVAEERWVRRLGGLLLACSLACFAGIALAMTYVCVGGKELEVAAIGSFGAVIVTFVAVTISVLHRMRSRHQ